MKKKGVPYVPVNKRANNPDSSSSSSFEPALDSFSSFFLLVVSSNASDWGCLTLVRETWGREIQNGRRRRWTFHRLLAPAVWNFPSKQQKKCLFLFSLRFSFQLVWRHVVVGSSSSSGGVSFSLGLLFTLGPCWRKKKGKKKRKKGLERLGLAIWHWWNKQGLGSQLFCCFFHLEGPATLFTTPTPPVPFLPLFEIFFSFFLNFPRRKLLVCVCALHV